MTRMTDVARVAQLSPATVSRVLSHNQYVSEETRRKVLEAVAQLGYTPNRLASNLRKMTSRTVIVVMPGISNPFFAQILKAFNDVARHRGYHVLLGDTGNDLNGEREFIELVKEKFVDGVLLATARIPEAEIAQVSEVIPVVLACEYINGSDIPTVAIDNVGAARAATQYLISLGHRQIAHLSGPLSVVLGRGGMAADSPATVCRARVRLSAGVQGVSMQAGGRVSGARGYRCRDRGGILSWAVVHS